MAHDYRGLFERWELAIAGKLVREFHATSRALQHEEADDLLQEVLLHWHHARASHDPLGKASIRTYMARVVRNKLIDLIRERESDKEKVNILAIPTEVTSEGEPGSNSDDAGGDLPEPEEAREHRDAEQSLQLDLARALARLTPRQRELCQLPPRAGHFHGRSESATRRAPNYPVRGVEAHSHDLQSPWAGCVSTVAASFALVDKPLCPQFGESHDGHEQQLHLATTISGKRPYIPAASRWSGSPLPHHWLKYGTGGGGAVPLRLPWECGA